MDHYFVGGSTAPISLPPNSEIQPQLAIERLKHAATLDVLIDPGYKRGNLLRFQVDIKKHRLRPLPPTGLTELRQLWLSVSVVDAEDKIIYQSGQVDDKGGIDPKAIIYHTTFGDEEGSPTLHVWKATHIISDNRIPPKGQKEERFVCLIPADAKSPIKIKTVLHYRSAPQDVADSLLKEKSVKLPIIDMVEIMNEVKL